MTFELLGQCWSPGPPSLGRGLLLLRVLPSGVQPRGRGRATACAFSRFPHISVHLPGSEGLALRGREAGLLANPPCGLSGMSQEAGPAPAPLRSGGWSRREARRRRGVVCWLTAHPCRALASGRGQAGTTVSPSHQGLSRSLSERPCPAPWQNGVGASGLCLRERTGPSGPLHASLPGN